MFAGTAPALMIDLAAAHIEEQHRAARGRADAAQLRRPRFGRIRSALAR
jgi:hypothetical protein